MSLQGDLEDLPLLDILQIVAFAEKTGYLTIQASSGDAGLVFEKGRIVASFTWDSPPLVRAASQAQEQWSALIRQRVETSLEQLTRLREGPFRFELTKEPPARIGSHDLSKETLTVGINSQEVLLGLAQGIDEDRRDSVAAVESAFVEAPPLGAEPVGSEPEPAPEQAKAGPGELETLPPGGSESAGGRRPHSVLLVEDEADVREALSDTFVAGGVEVLQAGDPLSALGQARALAENGRPFVLVVDRGMPSSDGTSFDGGLELVRRLRQAELRPPVLLMTDRMTRPLEERIRRLGVARTVFKPGLSRLDPAQFEADLRAFAVRILDDVLPGLVKGTPAGRARRAAAAAPPRRLEQGDGMATLVRRLQELSGPRDAFQVSTLVMKVAREFFERAVLFVVKDDALRGLTAFGPAARDEIVLLVRELVIPLDAPTVLGRAAVARRSFVGLLPEEEWDRLEPTLGRFRSSQVAVLPLTTHHDTIALLFGDNPETGAELGSLDSLEIFLNQAGLALENVFLQRKLRARETSALPGESVFPTAEAGSGSRASAATRVGGLR